MSELIKVPGIGDGEGEVIEILVKVGDKVEAEQSLVTLESDKASMEIPCPKAGTIKSIKVKMGDTLKEGDDLIELESEGADASEEKEAKEEKPEAAEKPKASDDDKDEKPAEKASDDKQAASDKKASGSSVQPVKIPDLGSDSKAKVIEILVKKGDTVEVDQSLIVLESDKASMEIPSPVAGTVESVEIKLEQDAGTGDLILHMKVEGEEQQAAAEPAQDDKPASEAKADKQPEATQDKSADSKPAQQDEAPAPVGGPSREGTKVHAGPAVRLLAREMGVDLAEVKSTGPRDRILKEDVQNHVKSVMKQGKSAPATAGGSGIPAVPEIDFSRFGEIEVKDMTRLQQIGAANIHRSWLNVPHVTQFDLADISELETFRKDQKAVAEKAGVKLTILPFLLKACAHLLREQANFNVALAPNGKQLIHKNYVHIGFAVDTPDGLMVPVIRDVDKKSLLQLAGEAAELAEKARNKKLGADGMQGACFTISSLGHIGGTYFTPIVNAPEVAILGVSKATMQPVWDGSAFQPKLMLPLSLSYDHRAINGAAAAQFTKRLGELLGDIRSMLL
ncbi:dihydrolipoyllysine-residue acetyltransferase [Halopseudomonas pelagia]|uniref:Acetyltransferase component of pyruvate dehydrogenase complex n=1 Tax=Halopseudomonas pelagia TaxID=553151 RepID=A0AA92EMI0_9GAMM|nr:dihydrolipoyllysine-residue acetyltransferase [Halopseudomonas pelagia]PCD00756.1 dihydrolipoyllysine-residue acetyltransferase [Halopseudomonas pelagia]QFY58046.1 dihydrolipoyllysine-residue acetyltransferase [Halopseudomonas pelagia]